VTSLAALGERLGIAEEAMARMGEYAKKQANRLDVLESIVAGLRPAAAPEDKRPAPAPAKPEENPLPIIEPRREVDPHAPNKGQVLLEVRNSLRKVRSNWDKDQG
jgi:hypothetical protein